MTAYRNLLAITAFRRFWLGFTFSSLGDAMTRVALTWYVFDLTGSARSVGWLLFFTTGPIVIGGLAAGWLLDRFDRRKVLITDSLVRGAAIGLIPLLAVLHRLELWHVYLVAAIYGLLMMIGLAGGPTVVPSLVQESMLETANAMEMLSFTFGGVIGPVAAGLLLSGTGAPYVLLVDVVSYLGFALAMWRIRIPPDEATAEGARSTSIMAAVRLLLEQPVLRATTFMFLVFNIGGGLLAVWTPVLVDERLHRGARTFGLLFGVQAIGEVVGALFAGSSILKAPYGLRICIAQALAGLSLLPIALGGGLAWCLASFWLFGFLSAPLTVWAQTLRMRIIPADLRGRTFALLRMLMQSGNPIGGLLGGLLAGTMALNGLVTVSAALVGLPGIAGLRERTLRDDLLPRGAPAATGQDPGAVVA